MTLRCLILHALKIVLVLSLGALGTVNSQDNTQLAEQEFLEDVVPGLKRARDFLIDQ